MLHQVPILGPQCRKQAVIGTFGNKRFRKAEVHLRAMLFRRAGLASVCTPPGRCVADCVLNAEYCSCLHALHAQEIVLRSVSPTRRHAGVCTDPPLIIMEYCQRGSLYDVLKQASEVPVSTQPSDPVPHHR